MDVAKRGIDYSALERLVSRQEVGAFRAQARAGGANFVSSVPKSGLFVMIVMAVVFLVPLGGMLVSLTENRFGASPLIGGVFIVAIAGFIFLASRALLKFSGRWEKWMRLTHFAEANGMTYHSSSPSPWYPGAIFSQGRSRKAYDCVRRTTERLLDIGNFRYVTGSGKHQTTHDWGFMAMALDRALPHMMLDSRANNGLFGSTNLPSYFDKDQVLSLEGDFDKYFTLYCPREYERDALYVFTPDLMALLIDEAAPFDVEIVDEWMFVYSSKPFDPLSRMTYERLFRIVRTVGAKTLSQTDRYQDDRVDSFEANVVAPQGRRLKGGVSVGAVIFMVAFAAFWLWSTVGGGLSG